MMATRDDPVDAPTTDGSNAGSDDDAQRQHDEEVAARRRSLQALLRQHVDAEYNGLQVELARRLNMSQQYVSGLLKGRIDVPTADIRRRLAHELGIAHVDLLVLLGELDPDEVGPDEHEIMRELTDPESHDILMWVRRLTPAQLRPLRGIIRELVRQNELLADQR
jgi:transcriptional regulator with XRE-family HTH domain